MYSKIYLKMHIFKKKKAVNLPLYWAGCIEVATALSIDMLCEVTIKQCLQFLFILSTNV